ncbi:lipoyl(octanoyl) transferase LipB [Subtercola sp. RTI3]|uniref:lipoyl(octanoyl) transferase LipB n=1 Tax=Subtercola sp. RTI3 TaxID=3048639 RepID=UPI002B23085D|nr:lipoyl(octanoyl) transferase LipB [Subtercola sp. RTI3]MEA9984360.1 lipoyl(octanoyl) transferase LipB [Subtercola sp. RTI3]
MIEFCPLDLGSRFIPYDEGLERQRDLHRRVAARTAPDTVLLLEHRAVYTAGKRTEPSELPTDGSEVVVSDRGGKLTWHGPGQLVGYPILRLPEPLDVVRYVRDLEAALSAVVAEFGIEGHRVEGRSGVWVTQNGAEAKIAAIGIRVSEGVSMHGFALNCSNSLEPYEHIVACGIRDAGVTTMTEVLGRRIEPREVQAAVEEQLCRVLERVPAVAA